MTTSELPPLRESLAAHGLLAQKRFGQHFLLDLNVTRKIARLAGPFAGNVVLEVGPGPGGLTRALLESDASRVIAIEMDERFIPLLAELAAASSMPLEMVRADALRVDELALIKRAGVAGPAHVVSNLPYNVGTPLLLKWLTGPFRPLTMTLMFQKEVADRIVAEAGAPAYGRLSVIAKAVCDARLVMDLPARAFTPPPKVSSAVVKLIPHPIAPQPQLIAHLERVTAAAFGQRRKMLRSSLRQLGGAELCTAADIDPDARAETVDIAGFLRLAARLQGS